MINKRFFQNHLNSYDKQNITTNAQTGEYCDMFAKGIIDPTKVVRTALQDAASIAGLLITTEAMIADKPEDKNSNSGGGGMPGGMGGMGGTGGIVTGKQIGRAHV